MVRTTEDNPFGGSVQMVGNRVENILGYQLDEFLNDPNLWFRLLHPDDISTLEETSKKIFASKKSGIREYRLRHKKTGEYHWMEDITVPEVDNSGRMVGVFGIARDITERKRIEEALRESLVQSSKKNRYETIISAVTRSVHQSINLQDVLENAVEAMSKNIDGAEYISIYLVEGEEAVMKTYRGYPNWFIERVRRIPYPECLAWKTIIEGKPSYCPDADQDTVICSAAREIGIKSYLSMPIRYGGKTIGCIDINSLKKNAFDEEELKLLEAVAQQIEVAINNAQIAEALRQSEERYLALFDQAPVGVYMFDKQLKITQCNKRLVQILQSSYDKIIGLDMHKLKDQSFMPAMEDALRGQCSYHEGFYEATTSPARLWLSLLFSTLRDANGNVIGGMGVIEDITERRWAEEALRASEERFRNLVEQTNDWVWEVDKKGVFTYVSPKVREIIGYESEEILGKTTFDFMTLDEAKQFAEILHPFISIQKPFIRLEKTLIRKEGYPVILETSGTPIFDSQGVLQGYHGIARDITERKETEKERERLLNELNTKHEHLQTLSRRLVELQESERHRIARELHDEIGQLLTGLKLKLGSSKHLTTNAVKDSLDGMETLVNELMERVREISLNLRPAMLDDMGLPHALMWHIERYTLQTNVRVEFKHSGLEGRRFTAELETAVYRIIQEALTNVARHAGVSEVAVRLWTNQDTVSLQIEDQGAGFDPEAVLAKSSTSGLIGIQQRVILLGGQLTIHSAPGAGTCLMVELPIGERTGG